MSSETAEVMEPTEVANDTGTEVAAPGPETASIILAPGEAMTPMHMLQIAVQGGADLDKLEKLMELQDRWEANAARKSFAVAMVEFKKTPPTIVKDGNVSYPGKGDKPATNFDHATLAEVVGKIAPELAKHGIHHDWTTVQDSNGITVTCILTHVDGHQKMTSLSAPADTSGGKNTIQGIGSSKSYLERYTLLGITGLAAGGTDDDGASSGDTVKYLVDPRQADKAVSALEDEPKARFHNAAGVPSAKQYGPSDFSACFQASAREAKSRKDLKALADNNRKAMEFLKDNHPDCFETANAELRTQWVKYEPEKSEADSPTAEGPASGEVNGDSSSDPLAGVDYSDWTEENWSAASNEMFQEVTGWVGSVDLLLEFRDKNADCLAAMASAGHEGRADMIRLEITKVCDRLEPLTGGEMP